MAERNFTDEEETEIGKLYLSGISARAIGRAYGLTNHGSITDALRRQDVEQRSAPERNRIYTVNPYAFDVIDEISAYWWGFLFADGSTDREKTVILALKWDDREHVYKLRSFLESNHPITKVHQTISASTYYQARLYVTERHLCRRLMDLGVTVGRPAVQPIIDNLPDQYVNHFIRGLFDGDGSIDYNCNQPRFRIVGNTQLIDWLWGALDKAGVAIGKKAVYQRPGAKVCYLTKTGRLVVLPIVEYIYKNAETFLDRKYQIAKKVFVEPAVHAGRNSKGQFCS